MKQKCILVANSAFTLLNFRRELIDKLKSRFEVVVLCPSACPLLGSDNVSKDFDNIGVNFIPIEFSRSGVNPFSDLKLLFNLYNIFSNERPTIVLNYTIKPTIYSSIAAGLARVKVVSSNITGLGYVFTNVGLKSKLLRLIVLFQYKIALKLNHIVFFQNIDDRNLFHKMKLLQSVNTKVINGSGINLEFYNLQEFSTEKVENSFIFVGRMLKDKGIYELIAAAKKIKQQYPNTTIRLVGGVDDNPNCIPIEIIYQEVSQGTLEFIGATEDVRTYLASSEVFVLPSYREGTPRAVLEAMAMSMPIITTDVPGCRETVDHGKNGFLVSAKNEDSLFEAMEMFILNRQLISDMSKESRKKVTDKYDVHKVNQSILTELYSLTKSRLTQDSCDTTYP